MHDWDSDQSEWERRADAEADEALAARDALRRRLLPEVATELLHRGDVVAVVLGDGSVTGTVVHTGDDLLVLRTATGDVDVCVQGPLGLRVVERRRSGGLPSAPGAQTFTARLFEHEAGGALVELGCPLLGLVVVGRLAAVARDHVVVDDRDGQRWHLSRPAVAWIRQAAG